MRIIIDSNRVLAAMIKESTTREILLDLFFEFIAPDFILTEIRKHEQRVLKAAKITRDEFEIILTLILERITIIPEAEYSPFMGSLTNVIEDPKDIPYLAVSIASKAYGIWTHDFDFAKQHIVKI